MGYYEENVLYKDEFFKKLTSQKSIRHAKKKKKARYKNIEPMGMYETLPGYELIEAQHFFQSLGSYESQEFKSFIEKLRLLEEKIRMEIKFKSMTGLTESD